MSAGWWAAGTRRGETLAAPGSSSSSFSSYSSFSVGQVGPG